MEDINQGDNVVLGHKESSGESGGFKRFSFFTCREVVSEDEYLLHSKYEGSKVVAVRYNSDEGTAEVLRNNDHLKRLDGQKVMYSDTFNSEYRYFIFVDGNVDPRLTAVGPNKIYTEVYGKLDGPERFVFDISSYSFLLTEDNRFKPLTSKNSMECFSTDRIPFAFSCVDQILTFDVDSMMRKLQVG